MHKESAQLATMLQQTTQHNHVVCADQKPELSTVEKCRCEQPVDEGDEGQGGHEAGLDGGLLQAHQAYHEQLEDEDGHYDLVKCLLPYLHNQTTC